MIGRRDQFVDEVPFGTGAVRVRTNGLEFSQGGRFGCQQLLQTSGSDTGPTSLFQGILAVDHDDVRAGPTNCRKRLTGAPGPSARRDHAGRMLASEPCCSA
ncbi:hypothetical protein L841_2648 [Mycobacterium sp. MAC_080597_8934]|nr:hypothetical protein L839_1463 [Mycobacterium avium MAV_120809_2495]ETZ56556.1 hypothetical protein L840_3735 [Mycobacterium sp. MAC_011194_8550]ETZ67647.1 hypothetical protein L841_2648 [Mycobacterium sp. MAC_080597_8934]